MRAILNFMVLFVATVAAAVPSARAETAPIQAFYGTFEGRTLFPMGEPSNRELSVRVERAGRFGFVVEWQTTIAKANHKPVRRIDVLEFEPTLRANVYAAVPRRGVEFVHAPGRATAGNGTRGRRALRLGAYRRTHLDRQRAHHRGQRRLRHADL